MKKVLLLLANGFEAYEAAAFTDVLGWADLFGDERIEVVTAGLRSKLKCTFAFEVTPMVQVSEVDVSRFDALAIPGGFEKAGFYEDAYNEEFLDVIRDFNLSKKPIASVCTGALPIGKSGVIAGRRATTYHLLEGERRKELAKMGVEIADEPLVRDGGVVTSTSPATAVDVAFALLEELTSKENADKVRDWMGFEAKKS